MKQPFEMISACFCGRVMFALCKIKVLELGIAREG